MGGDFQGGGVNLFIVVTVAFIIKNMLGVFDIFDIFADAGADEVILEPAIRPFDLAFGLRGEGVDRFDVAVLDDHLPLRIDVVGKLLKTHVPLVSSFDIAKDRMAVRIVG